PRPMIRASSWRCCDPTPAPTPASPTCTRPRHRDSHAHHVDGLQYLYRLRANTSRATSRFGGARAMTSIARETAKVVFNSADVTIYEGKAEHWSCDAQDVDLVFTNPYGKMPPS